MSDSWLSLIAALSDVCEDCKAKQAAGLADISIVLKCLYVWTQLLNL